MASSKVGAGFSLAGLRPVTDRLFLGEAGGILMLGPPQLREWSNDMLLAATDVDWSVDGEAIRASDPRAEIDVLLLDGSAADAALRDTSRAMTIPGSFHVLAGPASLGAFLVGGQVLDVNLFLGRRCASEQTALYLWRTAKLRGGAFWTAVASWIAEWTAERIQRSPDGLPRHDLWGQQECHTRFLVDAALLLLAAGSPVAEYAFAALETLAVPYAGGQWYLHDTVERDDGRNNLVLNTHLQATVALIAAGRDVAPALRALDASLALRPDLAGALLGPQMWAASFIRSRLPPRGAQRWQRVQELSTAARARRPHLRVPGGFVARDVGLQTTPHYFTVNLSDLAALELNRPTPRSSATLRAGLRFAGSTGYFRAQQRLQDPLLVLVPIILAAAGRPRAARRWAQRATDAGIAPAVCWPGYEDQPWSRLAAGTR